MSNSKRVRGTKRDNCFSYLMRCNEPLWNLPAQKHKLFICSHPQLVMALAEALLLVSPGVTYVSLDI